MKGRIVIHKSVYAPSGTYNYCDDTLRGMCSHDWDKVTCKKCLNKAGKALDGKKTCAEIEIAKAFHETYERFAPHYGYKTRKVSAVSWSKVPAKNKNLMISVVKQLLAEGVIRK